VTVGTGSSVSVDMGVLPDGVDGYAFYAKGPGDLLPQLITTGPDRYFTFGPPPPAAPTVVTTDDDSHVLAPGTYEYYVCAYVGDPDDGHVTVFSDPAEIVLAGGNGVNVSVPAPPAGYDGVLVYRYDPDGNFTLVGST
jgi:hypothetical protein